MELHVMLCVLLLMFDIQSEQTCTELEVLGMNHTQKEIKVKENSLINLTVHLNKFTCHEKWNWSLVKLSTYQNGKHFDVCKIIVSNGMCNMSGSSQCVCLGEEFIQFSKRVTQEDSQIFIWKWSDSHSLSNEEERELTLFVEPSADKSVIKEVIISFSVVIVIASIVVILVVRLRLRVKTRETGVREVAGSSSQTQVPMMSNNQSCDRVRRFEPEGFYSHLMRS